MSNELIEKLQKIIEREIDNVPMVLTDPLTLRRLRAERLAQAALTALIEHAGGDGVTQADRDAANLAFNVWDNTNELALAFAHHRQAAFADGFTAALQGAEAVIWRIEDDAFLYEDVSKALQEVISELQAMEQNWTGRVTIEHRQTAIKERDAQIVAWLRVRGEDYRMAGQGGYATVLDLAADAIERGEV